MGRHSGKNGIVKVGAAVVGDLVDFDFETTAAEVDVSAINDGWDDFEAGSKGWSGNLTVRFNTDDATQELLQAGETLSLQLFTDGDATGKTNFSGNAVVLSVGMGVSRNAAVDKKATFKGRGALTQADVV